MSLIPSFSLFYFTQVSFYTISFCTISLLWPVHLEVGKLAVHSMENYIFLYWIIETEKDTVTQRKKHIYLVDFSSFHPTYQMWVYIILAW